MGTNYYLTTDICDHCKRGDARLHIGKSSGGWCFGLHVMPDDGIADLDEWERRWNEPKAKIHDEYGHEVSPVEMRQTITNRAGRAATGQLSPEFYRQNDAEPGPNNLLRHRIDGRHCVGHGEGTWDLIVGEFF